MPLTLTIRNAERLDNGSPLSLVLDRRGALIGRAATSDWCLPDPSLHISSRHCEVRFSGGNYEMVDHSTNGTFLDGQQARLAGPHLIGPGDVFRIGPYEVIAALDDAAAALAAERNAAPPAGNWKGWTSETGSAAPAASASAWDARPASSAISGTGPMSQSWAAPPAASSPSAEGWGAPPAAAPAPAPPPAAPGWAPPPAAAQTPPAAAPSGWGAADPAASPGPASAWGVPTPPPPKPASEWSSPVAPPPPPAADDIWGKFAQSNVVDWARGGFGGAAASPPPAFAPAQPAPPRAQPIPVAPAAQAQAPAAPAPAPTPAPSASSGLGTLAQSAGVAPERLQAGEAQTLGMAGNLLRRLVAGMVVMLEARARAKSQLGAQGTSLEFDGNNPLKFARTPEQALEQLLNAPQRGFMDSERAVEDAFKDLQAHQMATLKAMQGALRATLDRFSPRAIRARAEQGGILSRILPGARDAALWAAYEREFSGVAHGSDEAFMEMFAKEFRRAYEEIARQR